ncbi:ATP-binding cassette domain-containing protein [Aristophania vespae]|uniref:ATP-binding cassette domain-containing protein n=1 Tax=Aristophania vespae TaxID=2697033 RepID=A0A6P1NAZ5_9PROT|nr:nitrate/sulfonate/bicarbonate ABC transporter ATP-binding protein [Aristophania vespae]QHI95566.1 ATP-binding cassette domain-containing protein [Aristophania vespae]UMM63226.1 Vitamin B12 import ATP-binding protein BtuD [Aristophania vespae]
MTTLLRLEDCTQASRKSRVQDIVVVEKVSLAVKEGEILGLVGRSGSGKSSLLDIMGGLDQPVGGQIYWKDRPVKPKDFEHVSIVLQNDALFPWLTISENIRLALEATSLSAKEKDERVAHITEIMDLDGYEGAFPRELSEAFCQRTALARALVRNPDLLLLDEPFLNLELLSAENLRTDLIELWSERRLQPLKAMVLATHAIEEAVLMCDRILLFSTSPGKISFEIPVPFAHPRNRQDASFRAFVDQVYSLMTPRAPTISEAEILEISANNSAKELEDENFIPLPDLSIETLAGLIEVLGNEPFSAHADLPELAQRLQMTLDDLLPLGETLQLLELAELEDGDIILTHRGRLFVEGDADARRDIMRTALLHALPLLRHIRNILDERSNHSLSAEPIRALLEKTMSENYARQTLNTVISWGRYAGIFIYDEESDRLLLEDED